MRKAAVESLERLTVKGEPETIKSLSECLKDEHAEVRESAVRALERAADEGEEDTLKAVVSCLCTSLGPGCGIFGFGFHVALLGYAVCGL